MMFELRVASYELRVSRDATHRRGRPSVRRRLGSKLATRHSQLAPSGLTLIELLITITIIATLATLFLGASNAAMEAAHAARTKTTIHKIHTLLMERWGSYTTRRVDVKSTIAQSINTNPAFSSADKGKAMADARLLALRELMKLEMPDRWSDVDMTLYAGNTRFFLRDIPSIAQAYNRRLLQVLNGSDPNSLERNGSAECLYLTVMLHTGDGEARTLFSRQDIGDTDGDGALEFLDGWGRAIRWVRWPAGFVARSDLMGGDTSSDHDPFDPFRRNSSTATPSSKSFPKSMRIYVRRLRGAGGPVRAIGYRLVPLVFSMGPDGIGDISTRRDNILGVKIELDPYDWDSTNDKYEFGSYGDNPVSSNGEDNSIDNIHNHLLDNR